MSSHRKPCKNLETAQLGLEFADENLEALAELLGRAQRGIELARTFITAQQLGKPHPDEGDRPARQADVVPLFPGERHE